MPNRTIKEYSGGELVRLALKSLRRLPVRADLIFRSRDPSRGRHEREIVLRTETDDVNPPASLEDVEVVLLSPRAAQGARGGKARARKAGKKTSKVAKAQTARAA